MDDSLSCSTIEKFRMPILKPQLPIPIPTNSTSTGACSSNSEHSVLGSSSELVEEVEAEGYSNGHIDSIDMEIEVNEKGRDVIIGHEAEIEPPMLAPFGNEVELMDMEKETSSSGSAQSTSLSNTNSISISNKIKRKKKSVKRDLNIKNGDTKEELKFNCDMCPFTTKYSHNLKTHKANHGRELVKEGYKKCKNCTYVTWDRTMQAHSKLHLQNLDLELDHVSDQQSNHEEDEAVIPDNLTAVTKLAQVELFPIDSPEKYAQVELVPIESPEKLTESLLTIEEMIELGNRNLGYPIEFKCMKCPHKSFSQEEFDTHDVKHLPEGSDIGPYICQFCLYDATDEAGLNDHYWSHFI